MLDAKYIRDNLEAVKENCRNRNVPADVDAVVRLDDERKQLAHEMQQLQKRQNEVSKAIPQAKDKDKKQALVQEGRDLREQVSELQDKERRNKADLQTVICAIPNMTHPDAPVGTTDEDNKVIKTWGDPPEVFL